MLMGGRFVCLSLVRAEVLWNPTILTVPSSLVLLGVYGYSVKHMFDPLVSKQKWVQQGLKRRSTLGVIKTRKDMDI
jgi:hypothetical protein